MKGILGEMRGGSHKRPTVSIADGLRALGTLGEDPSPDAVQSYLRSARAFVGDLKDGDRALALSMLVGRLTAGAIYDGRKWPPTRAACRSRNASDAPSMMRHAATSTARKVKNCGGRNDGKAARNDDGRQRGAGRERTAANHPAPARQPGLRPAGDEGFAEQSAIPGEPWFSLHLARCFV